MHINCPCEAFPRISGSPPTLLFLSFSFWPYFYFSFSGRPFPTDSGRQASDSAKSRGGGVCVASLSSQHFVSPPEAEPPLPLKVTDKDSKAQRSPPSPTAAATPSAAGASSTSSTSAPAAPSTVCCYGETLCVFRSLLFFANDFYVFYLISKN